MLQHLDIFCDRRARQALFGRRLCKRGRERAERREVQHTVAPLQHLHGIEGVALERLHELRFEWRATARRSKSTVTHRAACTPRDLAELGGIELAKLIAVELAICRKCYVID